MNLYHTHPSFGTIIFRSLGESPFGVPMVEDKYPAWWAELDECVQDAGIETWFNAIIVELFKSFGRLQVRIVVSFTEERRRVEEIFPEHIYHKRGLYTVTIASEESVPALVSINPDETTISTSDGRVVLSFVECWEGVLLHDPPAELVARFRHPLEIK
ncbi:hypothetical protein [Frankia sp. Cj3]|uniref:hypothetical protein n=1 Tax=Frankia sp. Cj3 TaxID=2880976 RepID=UPI001EF58484|nr:hypothetical protein [Frankia sp. Cj3]